MYSCHFWEKYCSVSLYEYSYSSQIPLLTPFLSALRWYLLFTFLLGKCRMIYPLEKLAVLHQQNCGFGKSILLKITPGRQQMLLYIMSLSVCGRLCVCVCVFLYSYRLCVLVHYSFSPLDGTVSISPSVRVYKPIMHVLTDLFI